MNGIRARYGAVRDQVIAWLEEQPLGTEFRYVDVAEELGLQRPSVSSVMNSLMRADNPVLGPGRTAGRFRVIRPVDDIREVNGRPVNTEPEPPESPGVGSVMEVLGVLKNDNLMLRAEDGSLWEAKQQ
jgi:hypothetical protein